MYVFVAIFALVCLFFNSWFAKRPSSLFVQISLGGHPYITSANSVPSPITSEEFDDTSLKKIWEVRFLVFLKFVNPEDQLEDSLEYGVL